MRKLIAAMYHDDGGMGHLFKEFDYTTEPGDLRVDHCLLVHGGADISPSLYKRAAGIHTYAGDVPSNRDRIEWGLMNRAAELGIPIIGIGRGAQMLCALAGGYLIQHVNNHGGMHYVKTYDNRLIKVNSIHHQMMAPEGTDHKLLAWLPERLSDVYYDVNEEVERDVEPELIYFNKIRGMAVQWHPEAMHEKSPANQYFYEKLKEFEVVS